jgi:hypothetical protein
LTPEVRHWLERLQARLAAWSDSPRLRELDAEHLGRLARVDPVDLLATIVAWSLWELEYRNGRDPLPFFMAGRPERVRRFNACQLASWLRDTMNTRGLKHSGPSVRAMRRVVRLLLAYRFQPGLEALAFAIGRKVEPHVREEIALEIQQLQEQQRVKKERAFNDRYPYGINADGSFDIYREG